MLGNRGFGAWRRWGVGTFLWLGATFAQAAHVVEPAPSWADWAAVPAAAGKTAGSDRIALLTDDQGRLDGARTQWFHRRVSKITASSGTDDASQFDIVFDPGFETVVLHSATVERNGQVADRLASARIDELRREDGLESGLIDGKLTLHLVLDDVRVGDIVDVAVSVRGRNPALVGMDYAYWSLQAGLPTKLRRLRVSYPAGRDLKYRPIGEVPEAVRGQAGRDEFLEWQLRDQVPLTGEEGTAGWFDPGPSVELGGARDWAAVVDWALPLYAGADDRAIATLAQELGLARGDASDANVLRAIDFVQDEIRYTGLELGAHAYQPYPPSEVIRRRYGDCKDKTTLLVGLLRHLGLEAHPALVDVDELAHIEGRLPAPGVFDHVIVRFEHGGKTYWVDATAEMQGGDLAHLAQADYGRALVVAPGQTALTEIAVPKLDGPRIDIDERFDLRNAKGGLADDADYWITTTYRGAAADHARRRFARDSAERIGEGYAESIAKSYPGLEMAEAPTIEDDAERNVVVVDERYLIRDVWRPNDDDDGTHSAYWLTEIDGYLPEPGRAKRRSPLALGEPLEIRQKLTVELDGQWPKAEDDEHVKNPWFDFRREVRNDGDVLTIDGRLKLLAREVPPAEAARFSRDARKAEAAMGYELGLTGKPTGAPPSADGASDASPVAATEWVDARLAAVLAVILATWGFVIASALRGRDSVAEGMWFRPRVTVRAALARGSANAAIIALLMANMVSALIDAFDSHALGTDGGFIAAQVGRAIGVSVVTTLFYWIYAAAMAWGGRLMGGRGRMREVYLGYGWASVPMAAILPTMLVLLACYGLELTTIDQGGPAVVATACAFVLLMLPLAIWTTLLVFPVLAEVHGFSLMRAIVLSFVLPLVLIVLLIGGFAALRSMGGG